MKTAFSGVLAASAVASVSAALTDDQIEAARLEYCTTVQSYCPTLFSDIKDPVTNVTTIPAATVCGGLASIYPVLELKANATGTAPGTEDPETFFTLDCRFGAINKLKLSYAQNYQYFLTAGDSKEVADGKAKQAAGGNCVAISHLGYDVNVFGMLTSNIALLSQSYASFTNPVTGVAYADAAEFKAVNAVSYCGTRANALCHAVYDSASVPCKNPTYKTPYMYESLASCLSDQYSVDDDIKGFEATNDTPILTGASTDCRIFWALGSAKASLEGGNVSYIKSMCSQTTWDGGYFCNTASKTASDTASTTAGVPVRVPAPDACEQFCNSFGAYCDVTPTNADFTDYATCHAYCKTWIQDPSFNVTGADGKQTTARSTLNSIGCRKYHVLVAQGSDALATVHCPHAGKNASAVCNQAATDSSSASSLFPSLAVLFALCTATVRLF